jgi:glycerophosphoryl diester phosphodiesterase
MMATGRIGLLVVACTLLLPAGASAQIVDNPWLERKPLNLAHQGGEIEVPSDTLCSWCSRKAIAV